MTPFQLQAHETEESVKEDTRETPELKRPALHTTDIRKGLPVSSCGTMHDSMSVRSNTNENVRSRLTGIAFQRVEPRSRHDADRIRAVGRTRCLATSVLPRTDGGRPQPVRGIRRPSHVFGSHRPLHLWPCQGLTPTSISRSCPRPPSAATRLSCTLGYHSLYGTGCQSSSTFFDGQDLSGVSDTS